MFFLCSWHKSEICLVDKDIALKCAQIKATTSGSIRDNGTITAYEADGCTARTLGNNGLKYEQTKQVEGATYTVPTFEPLHFILSLCIAIE